MEGLVIWKRAASPIAGLLLTVVNGCDHLQWFRHLLGYEDLELPVNETVSLARNVEHTVLQVVQSCIQH